MIVIISPAWTVIQEKINPIPSPQFGFWPARGFIIKEFNLKTCDLMFLNLVTLIYFNLVVTNDKRNNFGTILLFVPDFAMMRATVVALVICNYFGPSHV